MSVFVTHSPPCCKFIPTDGQLACPCVGITSICCRPWLFTWCEDQTLGLGLSGKHVSTGALSLTPPPVVPLLFIENTADRHASSCILSLKVSQMFGDCLLDAVPFFREGCTFSYTTFIEPHTYSEKSSLTSGALLV